MFSINVKIVKRSFRCPVNVKDKDGRTPLQIVMSSKAANFDVTRGINTLLEYGADVNGITDKHSKSGRYSSFRMLS